MTQTHELELRGCSPDPLMSYLKALGIFRLVSEQADGDARAYWKHDAFYLHSALDHDALADFFLNEYKPTPIVSPWNNRFRTAVMKGDKKGLDVILSSSDKRLRDYRDAILESKQLLEREGFGNRSIPTGQNSEEKKRILSKSRALLSDIAVEWLDSVYVLTSERPGYPDITSAGGTLGTSASGDISINFVQNLVPSFGLIRSRRRGADKNSSEWLSASLFKDISPSLSKSSVGQFNPGGMGGPNATVGFEGESLINPWDFVLMIEGVLTFAGALVRRLSPESRSKAVFPFTVNTSAAGYGTSMPSEYGSKSRSEFWAPLWDRPTKWGEVLHFAMEGRAQVGRRQASNGAEFVRAIAGLGTERRISSFQRFGFLQRTGIDGVFATPIGKFATRIEPKSNVLFDLDPWLNSLRRAASGRNAPAELGAVRRRIDNAIIEFCQRGQPRNLQDVLIAIGQAERWISKSGIRDTAKPLRNLSRSWLEYANDDSAEFLLARAMASILAETKDEGRVGPFRENLEPVETQPRVDWKEGSVSCVWTAGDPLSNMLSVLQRRCLEGRMRGLSNPPLNAAYSARLRDIASFLNGEVDIQRVADLALPMSFISYWHRSKSRNAQPFRAPSRLPAAYAVMKLTLLPGKFKCPEFGEDERDIRMEPRMLAMLQAGRVKDAYDVAHRRLIASGLRPVSDSPGIPDRSEYGNLLAAALLFPLDRRAYCALANHALRKPKDTNSQERISESM